MEKTDNFLKKLIFWLPEEITANHLTFLRLILVLPIIFFLISREFHWALGLFLLGALLDLFDGPLARTTGTVSEFGKILDPLADKLFIISVIMIIGYERFPHILIFLVIGIEVFLALLAIFQPLWEKIGIKRRTGSNIFGKTKMFTQSILILVLLINPSNPSLIVISEFMLILAIILGLLSIGGHLFIK